MEGKIVREEVRDMVGNLQAKLLMIKDDWSHGRMSHDEFMRELGAIKGRAGRNRFNKKRSVVTTFVGAMSDVSQKWDGLTAEAGRIKRGEFDVHVEGSKEEGRYVLSQAVE